MLRVHGNNCIHGGRHDLLGNVDTGCAPDKIFRMISFVDISRLVKLQHLWEATIHKYQAEHWGMQHRGHFNEDHYKKVIEAKHKTKNVNAILPNTSD